MAVLVDSLTFSGMNLNPSEPAFGIDLGTTNSAIGLFVNGRVEILTNPAGERTTPSYVSYATDPPTIGKAGQKQMKMNHRLVAYDAKRMIGLNFDDSALGGRDFDNLLLTHYARQIRDEIALDVFDENHLNLKIRLREICENVKKELSFEDEVQVELENVSPKLKNQLISYDFFKRLMAELIGRCRTLHRPDFAGWRIVSDANRQGNAEKRVSKQGAEGIDQPG
uniref:Heat shock protein 70 n=1 Tax=Panagrolaimus sp. JU765 TaxID=591449 RepID=A0AC34QN06_9BILA